MFCQPREHIQGAGSHHKAVLTCWFLYAFVHFFSTAFLYLGSNIVKAPYYATEKAAQRAAGILNPAAKQSAADQLRNYADKEAKIAQKGDLFNKDVWTIGSLKDQRTEFKGEWIERHVTEHNLSNTGTPVAGVPKSAFHKRSQLQ